MVTGAFGAHGLRKKQGITPDNIRAWETAAHYAVRKALHTPIEQSWASFRMMATDSGAFYCATDFQWLGIDVGVDASSICCA